MPNQSKIANSPHREFVEQQAANGVPARVISFNLNKNWGEKISHVTISSYLNKKKKGVTPPLLKNLEIVIEGLEKRIRGLEINAWLQRPGGSNHGFCTYSIDGTQSHSLSREEVFLHTFPDADKLEEEYDARVRIVMDSKKSKYPNNLDPEIWEEAREVYNIWCGEEEEEQKKLLEDQKIAAAKAEVERIEADRLAVIKVLEESAKKQQRQLRLQALRDAKLEADAGIDENGNSIVNI